MRRALVVTMAVLGMLAWPCLGLAADEQALRDVKFDNPEKQSVAAVILELENCYNTDKPDQLMSLFASDAKLLTGMKGNRKGDWISKKDYAGIVESKMAQLSFNTISILYFEPSSLEIKGQTATIKLPYMTRFAHGDSWEKGFFVFDLQKVGGKWLIKKMYWEVTGSQQSMEYVLSDLDSVCF